VVRKAAAVKQQAQQVQTPALARQDDIDQISATMLELRDEVEEKKTRNVTLRKLLLQSQAMLVVKDARIAELEAQLKGTPAKKK
jgi:septal ring factor EnvC (AmiA/AmiB activator)